MVLWLLIAWRRATRHVRFWAPTVTPDELAMSWQRTKAFLLDARAHLSQVAEGMSADRLAEFEAYVAYNEFELALDMLDEVYDGSGHEDCRVLELMALAAANMGLHGRCRRYDATLSRARGSAYETVLPD